MPSIRRVKLLEEERRELEALLRSEAARLARRARIVLSAAEGLNNREIARRCGCNVNTVRLWRNRWLAHGPNGLKDTPGRGRKRDYTEERQADVLAATLESPAPRRRWTARRLSKKLDVPRSSILRIWRRNGLRPHLSEGFEHEDEPALVEKVIDLVGLYLHPREKAAALWVDEKARTETREPPRPPIKPAGTQSRSLRGAPGLPMELWAALNDATGEMKQGRRHEEFLRLLESIDEEYPRGELHLILTRSGPSAHEHPTVAEWLARRPRYHLHLTPSSAAWIQQLETWILLLTQRQPQQSCDGNTILVLQRAVDRFIGRWNRVSTPFKWVKTGDQSLRRALLSMFRDASSGAPG